MGSHFTFDLIKYFRKLFRTASNGICLQANLPSSFRINVFFVCFNLLTIDPTGYIHSCTFMCCKPYQIKRICPISNILYRLCIRSVLRRTRFFLFYLSFWTWQNLIYELLYLQQNDWIC